MPRASVTDHFTGGARFRKEVVELKAKLEGVIRQRDKARAERERLRHERDLVRSERNEARAERDQAKSEMKS